MAFYLKSQKELGELVGKTDRTIRNMDRELPEDEKLCVKASNGKYDVGIFVRRYVKMMVDRATQEMSDLDAVKARHEIVKTEKTELEVARMRGDLVSVNDVRRLWGDISSTIMNGMIHLPSSLAPMVQGLTNVEVIASIIDAEIRRVLVALSETPLPPGYGTAEEEPEEGA